MAGSRTAVFIVILALGGYYLRNSRQKVSGPVVQIATGKLQGVISLSRDGREFHEFLGVPYAKPPIGQLRFESPEPPNSWDGIRDAKAYGAKCLQRDLLANAVEGNEDCLFLNVHTPKLNISGKAKPLPVLVFIHGGLFIFGASDMYRPDYFMDEDVVLVTINYRLASFGFLNTGDGLIQGNMGLKDQTMALKWVKQNIAVFGGDPDNVMIFGESAGGASVHLHLLSPMSKGLFHKAISQSGVGTNPWVIYPDPKAQAERFAKNVNCPTENSQDMVNCLKNLPAVQIVEGHKETKNPLRPAISVFVPTIDSGLKTKNTFLPEHPSVLLSKGLIHKVPWMSGVNSEEGLINSAVILRNETLLSLTHDNWNIVAPSVLYLEEHEHALAPVKNFYFENTPRIDSMDQVDNFTAMFSDRFFFVGLHHSAVLHSRHASVYLYYYSYRGEFSLANYLMALKGEYSAIVELLLHSLSTWVNHLMGNSSPHYGACHSDELGLQFHMPWMSHVAPGSKDYTMSKSVVKLWVDFAHNEKSLNFKNQPWPSQKPNSTLQYLKIDATPELIEEPFAHRVKFWDSLNLYPIKP